MTEQLRAWRAPPGWTAPHWLWTEIDPPGLPMTPGRFRWCLHAIGWSIRELGFRLNIREDAAYQWAAGKSNIPNRVAIWLEELVIRALSAPQYPDGWQAARD